MISCDQRNFLYLSDLLPKKHPLFFTRLRKVLKKEKLDWGLLPGTRDIWAKDYMPVQVSVNQFVNFIYKPDYLCQEKWRSTITDAQKVCEPLGIPLKHTDIILDGGNLVCSGGRSNAVIFCDKVFKENPHYEEKDLIAALESLLETDKLVFIPKDRYDVYGHADGLVRFLNADTVLINRYTKKDGEFPRQLRLALHNAGLDYIEIPCNMANNTYYHQANGCYINYLQMEDLILLPVFGLKEDEEAVGQFESLFKSHRIVSLESNEIAHEGGVLNCVSWGVKNCRLPCKVKP